MLVGLLAYANTFTVPFLFDDTYNIPQNPQITRLANYLAFPGTRYVGFLTFALNYAIGGLNVVGYHAVNLCIHIVNAGLVYWFVGLVCKVAYGPARREGHWIALLAALLFVVHPVQTQAVTYIVQRFASLVTCFYLLAVGCYLKWRLASVGVAARWRWYAASLLACVLAMRTKENSFTVPLMLLLVEAVFFGPPTRRRWLMLAPFLCTLSIIPLSYPGTLGDVGAFPRFDVPDLSRLDYLFTQFRVIVTYLRLLVWPAGQRLDYDYPLFHSFFAVPVFCSFLLLLSLFGLAAFLLRRAAARSASAVPHRSVSEGGPALREKCVAFGIGWFFLTLAVESSVIPIKDVIFEHRIYLPSVGFFLVTATLVAQAWERWRRLRVPLSCAMAILIGGWTTATYQRNAVWRDAVTLGEDTVRKAPRKARGHVGLGVAYQHRGHLEEAIREYQIALRLAPDYPAGVYSNLGTAYALKGHREEAIRHYQTALQLNPNDAGTHSNLGVAYRDQGRLDEAIREFHTALGLQPDHAEAHNNLGLSYKDQGRLQEALQEYQAALRVNPDYADAHDNLGVVFKDQGRLEEAIREFRAALRLQPSHAEAHNNLGVAYQAQGQVDAAIREYRAALRLRPNLAGTRYNLGQAYQGKGMVTEARGEFERALAIDPGFSAARRALDALSGAGRGE
ncbi:MAG: tetratricopeptide repeat protein [Deltaproteobacteria bacterium]|nr:tetratricopeptide repeat protein [Deltaproteobacteria bacterium]